MIREYPTKKRLRELFGYSNGQYELCGRLLFGALIWREKFDKLGRPNKRYAGLAAGTVRNGDLRVQVAVDGKLYELHRLIYIWHFGEIEVGKLVDHKDHNQNNYRVENLRLADFSQNNSNRSLVGGSSEFVGVYRNSRGKWIAQIKKDKKVIYLGSYDTEIEAAQARNASTKHIHGDFGVLNCV